MTTTNLPPTAIQTPASQTETKEALRYYSASQFQLIWWRFRKHRLAQTGAFILITMALVGLFAEFFAPYTGITRISDVVLVGPQVPRFCNDDSCTIRPFLPGITSERNPVTLGMEVEIDPSIRRDIYFFVEGFGFSEY